MKILIEDQTTGTRVLNTLVRGKAQECVCIHAPAALSKHYVAHWYTCKETCPLFSYDAEAKVLKLCQGVVHNDVNVL